MVNAFGLGGLADKVRFFVSHTHRNIFNFGNIIFPVNFLQMGNDKWCPCSPGDLGAVEKNWMDLSGDQLQEPPVDYKMMLKSLNTQKKTVNDEDLKKLLTFASDFGQEG